MDLRLDTDHRLVVLGGMPSSQELLDALLAVSRTLEKPLCYAYLGRFHFPLGGGWTIALSTESAGRIRIETCWHTTPRNTMWVFASGDEGRLASVVERMSNAVAEPV